MSYNDVDCNVKRVNASRYSTDVVIQHHDIIVTSADLDLSVHCQYDLSNKSVSNTVDFTVTGEPETVLEEGSAVDSPKVIMGIANRNGDDILDGASVGDMLQLRFKIVDRNSPYEIFVRDLVAMDGGDGNQITLLDNSGCPTEVSIMKGLIEIENTNGKFSGGEEVVLEEDVSGICINMVGLILACSVFLIAQLVLIVAWTAVWHRRRRNKLGEPLNPSTTTESLRKLYDSGYPRRI